MHQSRNRRGVTKLAVPVVIIVVLVTAGAYVFLMRGSATPTASTSSQPTVQVRTAVDQLVQDINDRSVNGLLGFYTPSSVVVWYGNTGGLSGRYSGTGDIKLIYAATVGKTTAMSANASKYAEDVFSPTHVNTTYTLYLVANSTTAGILTANISISEEWNWGGSGWQVSKENWTYKYFDASLLDLHRGTATTFPQWGVMESGGNPNLVSEKSFEWHAGPYVAASVYALLFGLAAFFALSRARARTRANR